VPANCVTFPWIMRAREVDEQEQLKGGSFKWGVDAIQSSSDADSSKKSEKKIISLNKSTGNQGIEKCSRDYVETSQGPWVTRRIKARSLANKGWQRLDPPGGGWGLFGWHTVPLDAKEVVVTEGEYDAMAVYQSTGRPAISLPNGCRSFPVEMLPMLERFEQIILWMDNDGPGQEGAEVFARKLGPQRVLAVFPTGSGTPKDANDALRSGLDLSDLLNRAVHIPHGRIATFADLRGRVLHEIMNPNEYAGVPVSSLPSLTKIIKGLRRGEMTVLTGATGSGKTTLLSQMSLDMAEQGVGTLWGSFEVKNTRLLKKLLQQFSRDSLPVTADGQEEALQALSDRFEELPMYFLKFHGSVSLLLCFNVVFCVSSL